MNLLVILFFIFDSWYSFQQPYIVKSLSLKWNHMLSCRKTGSRRHQPRLQAQSGGGPARDVHQESVCRKPVISRLDLHRTGWSPELWPDYTAQRKWNVMECNVDQCIVLGVCVGVRCVPGLWLLWGHSTQTQTDWGAGHHPRGGHLHWGQSLPGPLPRYRPFTSSLPGFVFS